MNLEEQLRAAVKSGLTHVSLALTYDGWRAVAAPSTGHQYVSGTHKDPIEALTRCLLVLPKAKKRTRDVTATVTAPEVDADPVSTLTPDQVLEASRNRADGYDYKPGKPTSGPKNSKPETAEDWLPMVTPRSKR